MELSQKEQLSAADLPTFLGSSIKEQLRDPKGRTSAMCDVLYGYGTHADPDALVMHFYPPGYGANADAQWPQGHNAFRERLADAVEQVLLGIGRVDKNGIDAGYANELNSFFVIVSPAPQVPDLEGLLKRFFDSLGA